MFNMQKAMEAIELRKGIVDVSYIDEMIDSLKKSLVNQIKTNLDYGFDMDNDSDTIVKLENEIELMKEEKKGLKGPELIKMNNQIEQLSGMIAEQKLSIRRISMTSKNNESFINYYQDMIESFVELRSRVLSSNQ